MPELIQRGKKASSPVGTTAFVGMRALDPFLQHSILAHGTGISIINFFGSTIFSQGPTSNTGYPFLDNLNLSPYRLIILGMSVAAAAKHSFWKLFIGQEQMGIGGATSIALFNSISNAANALLFVCSATSPAYGQGEGPNWSGWPGTPLVVGSALFVVGLLTETIAEIQRASFKREHSGVPYTKGLFGLVRHPNYGGYTLWRTGFALACGGWTWGAVVAAFFTYSFASSSIPDVDEYCQNHYADLWHDYKKTTPYKLFPYIY